MKKCNKCKTIKELVNFYKNQKYCKQCNKDYYQEYRKKRLNYLKSYNLFKNKP